MISTSLLQWFAAAVAIIPVIAILKLLRAAALPSVSFKFPDDVDHDDTKAHSADLFVGNIIQCHCPATGRYLAKFAASTRDGIDVAVENCLQAQKDWKKTTFAERTRVLRVLLEYIKTHQDEIVRVACRDSGKTKVDAALGEILVTLEKLAWTIKHGEAALRPSRRAGPANLLVRYKTAQVEYEPLGVVVAIVSWNYPLHNLLNPVISALFSGNGIVVKCSEAVVWSSTVFADLTKAALESCGHSRELVQLVCPLPADADHLTAHPDVSHVTFIGSKPVAHHVLAAAATALTPVTVELGGKDAAIVLDEYQSSWQDCNALASVLLRGCFQSAGQNCIGIERIIAQPKAYHALSGVLSARIPGLRLGSSLDDGDVDIGAMINDSRFATLEQLIADAVSRGAKLLQGGKRYRHPQHVAGAYFEPTMLIDVTADMPIANTELFAPVILLMRASTVQDAIEIANATKFGLGGAVFGRRNSEATESVVRELKTANIAVNDFATFYVCQLPFGGVRDSGYGKFGGEEGLRALCLAKSVCRDAYPVISTSIPRVVDYPLNAALAWSFVVALNTAAYATSAYEFCQNLATVVRKSIA